MAEEAEVTVNQNSSFRLEQPFEATTTSANTNTSTSTIDVKPLTQTSNQNVDVKPLSQTVDLRPVKVDSRQELAVTDPIRTDSSSVVDLRPLVIEICQRTGQASLPPTHVCQPYRHRIGLTVLGMELFGLVWSGENQTIVEDRPGRPFVAWGPVLPAPPVQHVPVPGQRGPHHLEGGHGHEGGGGLRIRLTG